MTNFHELTKPELLEHLDELQAKLAEQGRADDVQRLLQDLQVHQIELEMQNRELSEAQSLLEQSRDRYADLYDFAPVGYMSLDDKGRILEINLTGAALLGMERARIVDYPFSAFLAAGHVQFFEHLKRALNPERDSAMVAVEVTVRTPGGEQREVRLESLVSRRHEHAVCRTALLDITERRRAEEALQRARAELETRVCERTADLVLTTASLRESREQLQAILNNAPSCIFVKDLQGRYVLVNRECERLFGFAAQDILGKTDYDLFELSMAQQMHAVDGRIIETRMAETADQCFDFPGGSGTFMSLRFPLLDETGAIYSVCGVCTDISERKQTESKLRQAAAVFDNTDQGIIITRPNGEIIAVNRAFTQITGYAVQEVLGKHPRMLHSDLQDTEFQRRLSDALTEAGRWQGEVWYRGKNCDVYPVWENVSAVRDDSGAVVNFVSVFSNISVIKETERRLLYLAEHDPLTGIANRLLFDSRLDHALEAARRHGRRLALLFLDLDRFKLINDTMGHQIGDALLQAVATRLRGCVRAEDTLARLGGDEFALVLGEIRRPQHAARVAREALDHLSRPFTVNGHQLLASASIGIAMFPDDATSAGDLKKAADAALYLAKENGRGNYQFYATELTDKAFKLFSLAQDMRRALGETELLLLYQPIICARSGQIVGVEALLRWAHPKLGLLAPGSFLAEAEDAGLSEELDDWVLRTATKQGAAWRRQGLPPFRLSVNLLAKNIGRDDSTFVKLKTALADSGFEPQWLEIEVSEGTLQTCPENVRGISALKSLGVSLAIDDFGTAYSCLASLATLPVDALKIDRSFIEGIPNAAKETISSLIVDMGRKLHLRVIAEGVSTEQQQRFLSQAGCDELQGYLFSRPVSADELVQLVVG